MNTYISQVLLGGLGIAADHALVRVAATPDYGADAARVTIEPRAGARTLVNGRVLPANERKVSRSV